MARRASISARPSLGPIPRWIARLGAPSVALLALLAAPGCAISRSTLRTKAAGVPVEVESLRVSVLRVGVYSQRTTWGSVVLEQLGCDAGVSGNATLGAVGIGALAAGPLGAAAGGAAAAASEWARRGPEVSHAGFACPVFPRRVVPPVPEPLP